MIDGYPLYGTDAAAASGAIMLGDEAIEARLGAIDDPDAFVAEARAIATGRGIAFDEAQVRAAIRPDLLGIGRFMPAPVTLDRWPSRGWLPTRSVPTGGAPAFDWAWFGPEPLTAPFYEESVRRFAPRPFSEMFRTRTSMEALVAGADPDAPAPSGFIFHMTRCGSTLIAQMLAADPRHVVLSEPEPLDAVLRWVVETAPPVDVQIAAVRAVVAALGRDRSGDTRHRFVKLDGWHTLALPLLRAAFPNTPWLYVHRDPVEVLVSQERERTTYMVAGMLPPGIVGVPDAEHVDAMRYAALAIARFAGAVIDHWPIGGGMLVDYRELPGAMAQRIVPHFGLAPDAATLAAMAEAAARDSKMPGQRFTPDSSRKRRDASDEIRAITDEVLRPVVDRLDSLRGGCFDVQAGR